MILTVGIIELTGCESENNSRIIVSYFDKMEKKKTLMQAISS